MWIKRDIEENWAHAGLLEVRIVTGPRQAGKSALLDRLAPPNWQRTSLDGWQERDLANRDPSLFIDQVGLPVVIDEIQYAPPLFSELKRRIDIQRRTRRASEESAQNPRDVAWCTGSNQIVMDREVKESLAGRASYVNLHTLSVAEIAGAFPECSMTTWLERGGWPELYANDDLDANATCPTICGTMSRRTSCRLRASRK